MSLPITSNTDDFINIKDLVLDEPRGEMPTDPLGEAVDEMAKESGSLAVHESDLLFAVRAHCAKFGVRCWKNLNGLPLRDAVDRIIEDHGLTSHNYEQLRLAILQMVGRKCQKWNPRYTPPKPLATSASHLSTEPPVPVTRAF
jgi:hypothetical protein